MGPSAEESIGNRLRSRVFGVLAVGLGVLSLSWDVDCHLDGQEERWIDGYLGVWPRRPQAGARF